MSTQTQIAAPAAAFPLIYSKMCDIYVDAEPLGKGRLNESQGYSFRGIDDTYNALHRIFAKHRVFPMPTLLKTTREERQTSKGGFIMYTVLEVKYTFYAEDGSSVEAIVPGEGMDTSDKSSNKAISGAQKYALLQIFMIPTKGGMIDSEEETLIPLTKAEQIKQDVLFMIGSAPDVAELTRLKEQFKALFKDDKDIKAAGKKRYDDLETARKLKEQQQQPAATATS